MSGRVHDDWLTAYLALTDNSEPPLLYKKWCGVSVLAACLQRRCYTLWETEIYPNFYIVLIGGSALRKGTAMEPARRLLNKAGVTLSAESITREALIRAMVRASSTYMEDGSKELIRHSSLTVFSPELAVFLGYENKELIANLCDWFDCKSPWVYETKNKGTDSVEGMWLNIIGATTPDLIRQTLPSDAIGGGLTSRIIFVYGSRKHKLVPYPVLSPEELKIQDGLVQDMELILSLQGRFVLTEQAQEAYIDWYIHQDANPPIEDPNFAGYIGRRPLHIRKLMMIMSASRTNEMIITADDFYRAVQWLEEVESPMCNTYMGYGKLDLAELIPRVKVTVSRQGKVTLSQLVQLFYRDVTKEDLLLLLETMQEVKMIKMEVNDQGIRIIHDVQEEGPRKPIF